MYFIGIDMSCSYHKGIDVLCGIENIVDAIKEIINKANTRYDACADSSIPSFIVKQGIMSNFIDFKYKRDGREKIRDRMSQIQAIEAKNLTNKKLDDQITSKKNSSSQPPSIKIQLWSDEPNTHFAIKLSNLEEFLVATSSPTEKYTKLIEESDYLEDIQYNWEYTKPLDKKTKDSIIR